MGMLSLRHGDHCPVTTEARGRWYSGEPFLQSVPENMAENDASTVTDAGPTGWRFANVELNLATLELRVDGRPTALERKPLEILRTLLEHAGEVVTKDELIETVWAGRIISDATLTKAVAKLRAAIGDDAQKLLRTVYGYGYRLVAPVEPMVQNSAGQPTLAFEPGQAVTGRPNFLLQARLGAGAAAEVWLAEHAKTRESRVFKFARDAGQLGHLKREVAVYRLLRSVLGKGRQIVEILDWNFEDPPFFIELEHVPGGSLHDQAEVLSTWPRERRLMLIAEIAETLATAHELGVLHKDLKPANILLDTGRDDEVRPRLADFGSATLLSPNRLDDYGISRLGRSILAGEHPTAGGTPLYLAPEVIAGELPTARADIYALGVMLYQLIVGDLQRPLAPGWEEDVDDILLREDIAAAASGRPDNRLGDARELAERLRSLETRRNERAAAEQLRANAARAEAAVARVRARRPWVVGLAGSLVAGLALSTWQWQEAVGARAAAEREAAQAAAVNTFLTEDLLAAANPMRASGHDVSVRELLDRAAEALGRDAALEPAVEAAIRVSLGRSFYSFGEHQDAELHLRRAHELSRDQHGALADATLEAGWRHARVLAALGRVEEVETLIEPIVAARRTRLGVDHPDVLKVEAVLGDAARYAGQWQRAIDLYELVVARLDALEAPRYELVETLREGLLRSYHDAERLGGARALVDLHIDGQRQHYGEESAEAAIAELYLAGLYRQTGQFEAAEGVYLDVLEQLQRRLGPDHSMTVNVHHMLAMHHIRRGSAGEAIPHARRSYEHRRDTLGSRHAMTLAALNNLAVALREVGEFEASLRKQEIGLATARELFGPQHPTTLILTHNKGMTRLQAGETEEARPLLLTAMENGNRSDELDGLWQGHFAWGVGRLLLAEQRIDEARERFEHALWLYERRSPEGDQAAMRVRESLAALPEG